MTWKNSRHGPCEFTQSVQTLVARRGWPGQANLRNFRGLTLQNNFYDISCRVEKTIYNENGYEAG